MYYCNFDKNYILYFEVSKREIDGNNVGLGNSGYHCFRF